MGYTHIDNLYKSRDILAFSSCYAMEKIHGTSAHISWNGSKLSFFSGGVKHESFVALFDCGRLEREFRENSPPLVTVYGEAYGGKCQAMSDTYGPQLRFVAFEVKIGDKWLSVPQAERFVRNLGLDFVPYREIETSLEAIDAERDRESEQAIKVGMGPGHPREGIVLRPIIEVIKNDGERIIAKHKSDAFRETRTSRPLDAGELDVLTEAQAIADEWVTPMRLTHVLDGFPEAGIQQTGKIVKAMMADIEREANGEVEFSRKAWRVIGSRTASMFKAWLQEGLYKKP